VATHLISDTKLAALVTRHILEGAKESKARGNRKVLEVAKAILFALTPPALMAILANVSFQTSTTTSPL
jgi:hypothetical protein